MAEVAVDARAVRALRAQLARRRGERVGWKLGLGDRERIGDELVVGHLTSATQLAAGATYQLYGATRIHADAEVAVQIGDDGTISCYAAALELVDLDTAPDDPEAIVADNIFHRAFAFGPPRDELPPRVQARLLVNDDVRATGDASPTLRQRIAAAADMIAAAGERLEARDWIITGSVVQVAVHRDDEVVADFPQLGAVGLRLA
jgi:2-keto-4-pentenoate hydratase